MLSLNDKFEFYFKMISYSVALCGLFALFFSGGIGVFIFTAFVLTASLAWVIEGSKWQISERWGVVFLVLVIPIFYLDWKYKISGFGAENVFAASSLSRLILFLCAIKLLQKKTDRDWIFIYLISFFEVLLAAGLSISPFYLLSLFIYLLCTVCAVITFEIRRTSRTINKKQNNTSLNNVQKIRVSPIAAISVSRLGTIGFALLVLITVFAIPLFFVFPRVGGAGLGSNSQGRSSISGFSDSVRLGEIGKLKLSDKMVMRIRLEGEEKAGLSNIYWRGIALDSFDNLSWRKSKTQRGDKFIKGNNGFFLLNQPKQTINLVSQTFYLEPISTPILFTLSKPISIQSNFKNLRKDAEGSIRVNQSGFKRMSYLVRSDISLPSISKLREDNSAYSVNYIRYLNLPRKFDQRIAQLAKSIAENSNADNRYDTAKSIATNLQTQFSYTIEQKAKGKDPLADFLFNVKEGHCEYFSTAMAIMLRTQGIATRIVNGFQRGEYNKIADIYVVKQRDAHSWVEVYFPGEDAWVTFDPTPFDGQFSINTDVTITGRFNKYLEALETFWIQYFVSYDSQEQRSLFESAQNSFVGYKNATSTWLEGVQKHLIEWWHEVRGDKGYQTSILAVLIGGAYFIGTILGLFILIWLYKRVTHLHIWGNLNRWIKQKNEATIIGFYERMHRVLEGKGFTRKPYQTPLEFAFELNIPVAVKLTERYNHVRFGKKNLSAEEAEEIESWLEELEKDSLHRT